MGDYAHGPRGKFGAKDGRRVQPWDPAYNAGKAAAEKGYPSSMNGADSWSKPNVKHQPPSATNISANRTEPVPDHVCRPMVVAKDSWGRVVRTYIPRAYDTDGYVSSKATMIIEASGEHCDDSKGYSGNGMYVMQAPKTNSTAVKAEAMVEQLVSAATNGWNRPGGTYATNEWNRPAGTYTTNEWNKPAATYSTNEWNRPSDPPTNQWNKPPSTYTAIEWNRPSGPPTNQWNKPPSTYTTNEWNEPNPNPNGRGTVAPATNGWGRPTNGMGGTGGLASNDWSRPTNGMGGTGGMASNEWSRPNSQQYSATPSPPTIDSKEAVKKYQGMYI